MWRADRNFQGLGHCWLLDMVRKSGIWKGWAVNAVGVYTEQPFFDTCMSVRAYLRIEWGGAAGY